jgi:hypothetical protein
MAHLIREYLRQIHTGQRLEVSAVRVHCVFKARIKNRRKSEDYAGKAIPSLMRTTMSKLLKSLEAIHSEHPDDLDRLQQF